MAWEEIEVKGGHTFRHRERKGKKEETFRSEHVFPTKAAAERARRKFQATLVDHPHEHHDLMPVKERQGIL